MQRMTRTMREHIQDVLGRVANDTNFEELAFVRGIDAGFTVKQLEKMAEYVAASMAAEAHGKCANIMSDIDETDLIDQHNSAESRARMQCTVISKKLKRVGVTISRPPFSQRRGGRVDWIFSKPTCTRFVVTENDIDNWETL